jgi:thimet oligopeptidase
VRLQKLVIALLLFIAFSGASFSAEKLRIPSTAAILAGTPQQYASACNADMDRAKSQMAALKAMEAPRDPIQALDAYDEAELALSNALARSGLAREVEPAAEMRVAAEKCEQEADALNTEFSLDRGIFNALVGLDRSKLDFETSFTSTHAARFLPRRPGP